MTIIDKITSGTAKVLGKASNAKPMRWIGKQFEKDPEKALAYTAVMSIAIKDGVGCYKYVTQSLKNEKIPEKQRGFVAALDLTNGVLMIAAQIAMFFAMRKFSEPLFDRIFKASFGDQAKKKMATKIRMLQNKANVTSDRKLTIYNEFKKVRKDALEVFKFVTELIAATIIGKRVVVPFIATPLANKLKDKMPNNKHEDKKVVASEKENQKVTC